MTWRAVARNDVREAVRSRRLWVLSALFLVVLGGLAFALAELAQPDFDALLEVTAFLGALLLPLVGILLGYDTVVSDRESGSLVLLMSLPNSRQDVVLGKLVGRAMVLAGPLLVGSLGATVVLVWQYTAFDLVRYVQLVVLTYGYGLGFVTVAAALSTALSSSRRVIGAAFGAYVALVMFWNQLVDLVVVILFRFEETALADVPDWAEFLRFVNPRTAFVYLAGTSLDVGTEQPDLGLGDLWFASPLAAVVVLLGWILVPNLVAYYRFVRTDV
jgi:ABC-2 type transport system permease protein